MQLWLQPVCFIRSSLSCCHHPLELELKARPVTKSALLDDERMLPQHVMLPHDVLAAIYHADLGLFHSIFTGTPDKMDEYWKQNQDLAESVRWPNVDSLLHCFF